MERMERMEQPQQLQQLQQQMETVHHRGRQRTQQKPAPELGQVKQACILLRWAIGVRKGGWRWKQPRGRPSNRHKRQATPWQLASNAMNNRL